MSFVNKSLEIKKFYVSLFKGYKVFFCNFQNRGSCGIFFFLPFPWLVYIQCENVLNFDPSPHPCLNWYEKKSYQQNKVLAYSDVQKMKYLSNYIKLKKKLFNPMATGLFFLIDCFPQIGLSLWHQVYLLESLHFLFLSLLSCLPCNCSFIV